jgi:hypothetical protein
LEAPPPPPAEEIVIKPVPDNEEGEPSFPWSALTEAPPSPTVTVIFVPGRETSDDVL